MLTTSVCKTIWYHTQYTLSVHGPHAVLVKATPNIEEKIQLNNRLTQHRQQNDNYRAHIINWPPISAEWQKACIWTRHMLPNTIAPPGNLHLFCIPTLLLKLQQLQSSLSQINTLLKATGHMFNKSKSVHFVSINETFNLINKYLKTSSSSIHFYFHH